MNFDEFEVRKAMDSRLSALRPDPARRERIRQEIKREEEPAVKKKLTLSLALTIVIVLVLTGVALAVGLNLFEYFGQQDSRLNRLAPDTSLTTDPVASVESASLGVTSASINSAYYDGQSLLVGYIIQNGSRREAFTPDEELLSRMSKSDETLVPRVSGEEDADLMEKYLRAVEEGTPFGMVSYSVYPSDHTETDDGIDLPPRTEWDEVTDDGMRYVMREYESPLPEAARNREVLNIQIRLYQSVSYLYFDGKQCYQLTESKGAGAMTASVNRVDAGTLRFVGAGSYQDIAVTVTANVSAVSAEVLVTAAGVDFPAPASADEWYDVIITDEKGNRLRTSECGLSSPQTISAFCEGTGKLPETLTVYLLMCAEGEWSESAAMEAATPVILTRDK